MVVEEVDDAWRRDIGGRLCGCMDCRGCDCVMGVCRGWFCVEVLGVVRVCILRRVAAPRVVQGGAARRRNRAEVIIGVDVSVIVSCRSRSWDGG